MIYQKLSNAITPITAQPFQYGYREYSPCKALKPYIRCFWTYINQSSRLIVPDLCADIVFDRNNKETIFCGASDEPFVSQRNTETFGIRFYLWTAALFSDDSLCKTLNGSFELEGHFSRLKKELVPKLIYAKNIKQCIALSEDFLINNLKERCCGRFTEALGEIITLRGICSIEDISKELHISSRQLERIFLKYSGLTPKKTAKLIRYQFLWQDILFKKNFSSLDKALEYGYSDQSHLLSDFRKFHTMTPKNAKEFALNDVAFLQDGCSPK